ncbi:Ppx/GppA family phosphatase [Altererythrobacter lutimaris]|uniref:Ppx/GppA family phosphatase n=1 Tax=Altererythrobacter lutimaris TaxID=2743979 RepID=A0A850H8U1_9SPHN|nr:Ppx/GppA family phosphatase [Altererythrobacter lutimaris]NVE93371.1 Ppx/GppA family phosphatase [Altererythrobacter lutimaris]
MSLRARRTDRDGIFSGNTPERAIIDIGSNTVRLVVYGGSMRAPVVLLNEKVAARLGREMAETGRIPQDSFDLALQGLRRFRLLLEELEIEDVETVATAASREAENGPDFIAAVKELGFKPRVISGEEEARVSAQGVIGAFPGVQGVMADLGGGSLELIRIRDGETCDAASLPLGTLRLSAFGDGDPDSMLKALGKELKKGGWGKPIDAPLYLVGGTWRAMAVYAMEKVGHPLSDPHSLWLDPKRARVLAEDLAQATPETLQQIERISTMRSNTMPHAAVLLRAMLKKLQPERLVFSSWGLREGLLYDRLEIGARSQDPLLAGLTLFAAQRGAPPRLSTRVAGWTVDAVPAGKHGSERLRLAATMLSLASMQIEPNLRLHQAVDWALHKRWIGIEAHERAMMAAAVCANRNHLDLPSEVTALASEEALNEAIGWGLSIRLARRLGARSKRSFQVSRLLRDGDKLVLQLRESHRDLRGLPQDKDMTLLANHLGGDYEIRTVPDEEWDVSSESGNDDPFDSVSQAAE